MDAVVNSLAIPKGESNYVRNAIFAAASVRERLADARYEIVPWTRNNSTKLIRATDARSKRFHLVVAWRDTEVTDEYEAAIHEFNKIGDFGAEPILYGQYFVSMRRDKPDGARIKDIERACQRAGCFWVDGRLQREKRVPEVTDLGHLTVGMIDFEDLALEPSLVGNGDAVVGIKNPHNSPYASFIRDCLKWRSLDIHLVANMASGYAPVAAVVEQTKKYTKSSFVFPGFNPVMYVTNRHKDAVLSMAKIHGFKDSQILGYVGG